MKAKYFAVLLSLVLVAALAFTGCAPADDENGAAAPSDMRLLMGTGSVGGTYYPLGGAIANVMTERVEGIQVTTQATGASVENMRLLASGEADLVMAMNNVAEDAWNGVGAFTDNPIEQNWSAIGVVYPEIIQQFAAADAGIESIADLAGKRVAIGPPGSGTAAISPLILEAYGVSLDDIEVNQSGFGDVVDLFKDGHVDAAFNVLAAPASAIVDITTARDIQMLDIEGEALEQLIEACPLVAPFVIPAGTYRGQDEDNHTVALQAVMYVRDDLPEEVVYEMTKAMYEGQPDIARAHARGDQIDLQKAADGVTTPFHPGAQRYLEEQGIL